MNRFYTLMLIPEKSANVKKLILPNWIVHSGIAILFITSIFAVMMGLDYWYVLRQLGENKELQVENRQLRQQVQIFQNQMSSIQDTMDRVEVFSNRLRVITNIRDRHRTASRDSGEVTPQSSDESLSKKKSSR